MRILFASMPADGPFQPLSGLAVYLKERGHDVRSYTGPTHAPKLAKLGIAHLPFRRANDVDGVNIAGEELRSYDRFSLIEREVCGPAHRGAPRASLSPEA
jgi:UDP:flavonoid glycosyltransferase YjiC (YdhE family)